MGMNSLLFIPNDHLDIVHKNPEVFASALIGAVNMSCVQPKPTSLGGSFSDFTIPHCSHADSVGLVSVGGNYSEPLLVTGHRIHHHTEEGQVAVLKAWADKLGYSVRKKAKKKG